MRVYRYRRRAPSDTRYLVFQADQFSQYKGVRNLPVKKASVRDECETRASFPGRRGSDISNAFATGLEFPIAHRSPVRCIFSASGT